MPHSVLLTVLLSVIMLPLQVWPQAPRALGGSVPRALDLNAPVPLSRPDLGAPLLSTDPNGGNKNLTVNCATETIGEALKRAVPGTTIQVTGLCKETVLITKDDITLDGGNSTTVDGGGPAQNVITIDGAARVNIRRLTVQNGFRGLLAKGGAAVLLTAIIAQDNANAGIMLDESATGQLTNCTAQRNGLGADKRDGIRLFRGSSATLNGAIVSNENGRAGILLTTGSTLYAPGAMITANRNGSSGISVGGTSNFVADTAGSLTLQDNQSWGMEVTGGSTLRVLDGTVTVQNNRLGGMQAIWESFVQLQFPAGATPKVQIDTNTGPGVQIVQHSTARINGANALLEIHSNTGRGIDVGEGSFLNSNNITVRNNGGGGLRAYRNASIVVSSSSVTGNTGNGLMVDDASVEVMSSSNISGNTASDVAAIFGARLTLNSSTIGTVACDETVLRRVNSTLVVCP